MSVTYIAKFGWCLTRNHDECRRSFESYGRTIKCGCDCHQDNA